jgi:hypothetical protein
MNTLTPQDHWRSEAFAEDLLDERRCARPARPRRLNSALLLVLPMTMAVLGGVVAFFNTMG